MSDTEKKLRAKIEELEVELAAARNETFTSEGSAFKGLHSYAVKWVFSLYEKSFSLTCKNCGAFLGPTATKTPGGKIR